MTSTPHPLHPSAAPRERLRRRTATRVGSIAGAAVLGLALTACGGSDDESASAVDLEAAPAAQQLGDVCGEELVVQLQWQPQSDMGALFALLGPDYEVDTATKSVSGTLVVDGMDTGTELTLRAGGPAIGFQSVTSQMYVDDTIDLGLVHADNMIAATGDQPVVGVTPLLTYSPAMLMWDPETQGEDFDITKLADSDATVVVSADQAYPAYLVAEGYATQSQLDPSYDGDPARFVGDPSIVQQGFATSEPYAFEHDTPAWDKPVGFQLLRDVGYDPYASNVTVRADRMEEMAPCLEKLVPIIQQSSVDYLNDPEPTNEVVVDVVASDTSYSPYSMGEATWSSDMMAEEGLVAEEGGTVGGYDMERAAAFVDEVGPMIAAQGNKVAEDLSAETLFTTEFVDASIGLD